MNPLRVEGEPCKHPRYVLDAEDRSVHCSTCGVVFDAFDILLAEAERYKQQEGFLHQARGETARLHEDIAELRNTLKTLRKSVDNENRKLLKLIARRKALEGEVEAVVSARGSPDSEGFQLEVFAAQAAERFQT